MEWIRVKDRLPEFGEYVLAYNGEGVFECRLRDGMFYESDRFGFTEDLENCDITHWMPLPEPPNEK